VPFSVQRTGQINRQFTGWGGAGRILLGSHIRNVDRYLLPIIALIVVVSLIPVAVEVLRARRGRRSV